MLWIVLGCALVLLLCGGLAADDKKAGEKIDAKKLVGKWASKEKLAGAAPVIEFTKDSKLTITLSNNGKELKIAGTYKVEGNKMMTTLSFGGKDATDTDTIVKLTDTELVTKDAKGK